MKAVDFIAYFDGSETEIKLGEKHQEVSEIIRLNKENFLHEGKIFISNYTFRAPFFLEGIMLNHIVFNNCIFMFIRGNRCPYCHSLNLIVFQYF